MEPTVLAGIRIIALYMATPGTTLPRFAEDAFEAITEPEGYELLHRAFSEVSAGTEALHPYDAYRLQGDLLPSVRGFAVSLAGRTADNATRFYWLGANTLRPAEPITDEATLRKRELQADTWALVQEHAQTAMAWEQAFYAAIIRHLRQGHGHTNPAVNKLVDELVNSERKPAINQIMMAYVALGLDPAETLRYALQDMRLPIDERTVSNSAG